jgi:hypothetical protein
LSRLAETAPGEAELVKLCFFAGLPCSRTLT